MAHMHTLHTLSIGNAIAAQGGNAFSGYIEQININSSKRSRVQSVELVSAAYVCLADRTR